MGRIDNITELIGAIPIAPSPALSVKPSTAGLAEWMYERIVKRIVEFEKSIPDDMQAGGRFVTSATGYTFSIDDVSFWNPDMIMFYGTGPDGAKVELLQHTSQLNLLLVAVPRRDDLSKPRRKIGFVVEESKQ